MLNWIVWNRTICIKMDVALNNLQRLICYKIQPTKQTNILELVGGGDGGEGRRIFFIRNSFFWL